VVEFRQWILVGLIIVFAVAEGIQRQVDGMAEGECIGFVAARDAVARSGVGGGVHEWQTGSKEYAILGVERMERGSSLIMIHGHAIYLALDAFCNREDYDEAYENPLPKLYHEKRDESEKVRFSIPKKKG
jgi:hypothetical protein